MKKLFSNVISLKKKERNTAKIFEWRIDVLAVANSTIVLKFFAFSNFLEIPTSTISKEFSVSEINVVRHMSCNNYFHLMSFP